ncbi:MAG: hypothetical protein ACP5I7_04735 [Sulfolobales archaeon]
MLRSRSDLVFLSAEIFIRIFILVVLYSVAIVSLGDLEILYTSLTTKGSLPSKDIWVSLQIILSSTIIVLYIATLLIPSAAPLLVALILSVVSSRYYLEDVLAVLITIIATLIYDNFKKIYSKNQLKYMRVLLDTKKVFAGKIVLSIVIMGTLIFLLVVLPSTYIYNIFTMITKAIKPYNIYEAVVINFITNNVFGEMILVSIFLLVFSYIIYDFLTLYSYYTLKNPRILENILFHDIRDLDLSFEGPGKTLYTFLISILTAPFIYSILNPLLIRAPISIYGGNDVYNLLVALGTFAATWIFVKYFLEIFSEEVSLGRRIFLGVIFIVVIYVISYVFYGWRISSGYFVLTPLDEFIKDNVYRYYSFLFYLLETLGSVMGFVP